jgi:hypothetical protein
MVEPAVAPLWRRVHRPTWLSALVAHALLVIGGSALGILTIVGTELLARRWAPDYLVQRRGLHVFSSVYGWAGRPGAVSPMSGGRVSLNARGYRGRELIIPKPGDRTRVVVLGDSVAFGFRVSDEQAFPHLLDVRDNGIEAGNLAVTGYGPGQELLVLVRDGLRQDPDVVVLAVCLRNDFVDSTLSVELYDGVTPRPRFRLVGDSLVLDDTAVRRSAAGRVLQWLADYSHLYNRLSALVPRREAPPERSWRHRKQEVLRDEEYAFRLTFALVMEMASVCRRHGVAFVVATFPNGLSYVMNPGLHERFRESLKAEGVWVLDVGARFRDLGLTATALALDETGHLGPRGHAVAAEILEGEIASRFPGGARPRVDSGGPELGRSN